MDLREEEVAQLQNYQEQDLLQLQQQLQILDDDIAKAEEDVAYKTNLLSAARGLVGMRGGTVSYAHGEARKAGARSRPKQRSWTQKDGHIMPHRIESTGELWKELHPCGMIFSEFQKRFEAPRQSFTGNAGAAHIVITDHNATWDHFLRDLTPGTRLWIVYWLDRNSDHWRHFVRPPRAKGGWRVGLFATRSPNRPSPIGLSLSVVHHVDRHQNTIQVSGVDILDETPLLAVKCYDSASEYHSNAKSGWLDEINKVQPLYYDDLVCEDRDKETIVSIEERALNQLKFIDDRSSVDITNLVRESLKRVNLSSACDELNRQNSSKEDQVLAVGSFRIIYKIVKTDSVLVTSVTSGMRRNICIEESECDPEARLHLEFQNKYQVHVIKKVNESNISSHI